MPGSVAVSTDPGAPAQCGTQPRRNLLCEGGPCPRPGSVRRGLSLLGKAGFRSLDALPVFDPDVCGAGNAGGGAWRSSTARSHSAQCLELATRSASRKNLVKGWRLAAQIAHAERDDDKAEGLFRKSLDFAMSIGNPVQRWKAEIAFGQFLHDAKRFDEAQQAFGRAFALMQRVRGGLRDDRLRNALDRNPDLLLVQSLVM